jgi:3-deoxy-D-manno-octulosonic-acid transferase
MRRSVLLPFYRLVSRSAKPFAPALLYWRRRNGREDHARYRERMGLTGLSRPEGRLVWVHAASVGDGQTLLPLIERLGARGFNVLLSTRTLASANVLKRQLPGRAFHQFMPLDVPAFIDRFLDHWQPDMVLLAGAELWPNVLLEVSRRRVPIIFVNARLSNRVYGYCRNMRVSMGLLMQRIDLCLTRSDRDAERFVDLGATSVQTVGDLLYDVPVPGADTMAVSAFAARIGARPVWVAAMNDADDGELVLEVHRALLPRYPDIVTIIVPRHARDGAAVLESAIAQNLAVGARFRDGLPAHLPNLFIADGDEVGLFYRVSDIAFVGRAGPNGHGPIEAAKLGCAILHRSGADPFSPIYDALDRSQGGANVKDGPALAKVLSVLFDDGAKLRLMQRNATQTVDRMCGGTARVMRAIEPHVVQMLVEQR